MLKRYILTFTLALISCIGTTYIHTISEQGKENKKSELLEDFFSDEDLVNQDVFQKTISNRMI